MEEEKQQQPKTQAEGEMIAVRACVTVKKALLRYSIALTQFDWRNGERPAEHPKSKKLLGGVLTKVDRELKDALCSTELGQLEELQKLKCLEPGHAERADLTLREAVQLRRLRAAIEHFKEEHCEKGTDLDECEGMCRVLRYRKLRDIRRCLSTLLEPSVTLAKISLD